MDSVSGRSNCQSASNVSNLSSQLQRHPLVRTESCSREGYLDTSSEFSYNKTPFFDHSRSHHSSKTGSGKSLDHRDITKHHAHNTASPEMFSDSGLSFLQAGSQQMMGRYHNSRSTSREKVHSDQQKYRQMNPHEQYLRSGARPKQQSHVQCEYKSSSEDISRDLHSRSSNRYAPSSQYSIHSSSDEESQQSYYPEVFRNGHMPKQRSSYAGYSSRSHMDFNYYVDAYKRSSFAPPKRRDYDDEALIHSIKRHTQNISPQYGFQRYDRRNQSMREHIPLSHRDQHPNVRNTFAYSSYSPGDYPKFLKQRADISRQREREDQSSLSDFDNSMYKVPKPISKCSNFHQLKSSSQRIYQHVDFDVRTDLRFYPPQKLDPKYIRDICGGILLAPKDFSVTDL